MFEERLSARGIGRRVEDYEIREHNRRYRQLLDVGQVITSEINMDLLFELIMEHTNRIMGTERSTVFLHDAKTDELWSLVATGLKKNEIRIAADSGIAGSVFRSETPLITNHPYGDARFSSAIDDQHGFRTRNLLCIPIVNRSGTCVGVLEALNKISGVFDDSDATLLASVSKYVAIAVENARLYEEIRDYSEKLKETLFRIETVERIKSQLTKFVPLSVRKMVEEDPQDSVFEKQSMSVSVLFLDIEGFSAITENNDQRAVDDMVERHFSRYLDCIKKFGGDVNETSGDGLMVIFRERDAEGNARDAVRAGLEIAEQNRQMNRELTYPWGEVTLHLGINSGKARVGCTRMQSLAGELYTYTASGIVTVLAARVGALSHGSRLYVGPLTHHFVEAFCEADFLGRKKVKNVKGRIPVYWVKGLADGKSP